MSATTVPAAAPLRWRPALLITFASAAFVSVGFGLGWMSLPGLALGLIAGASLAIAVMWNTPWVLAAIIPAMIPLPQLGVFFPFEALFGVFTAFLLLHGLRTRAAWLHRSHPIELVNLALFTWALFSAFWSWDSLSFLLGVRRLAIGLAAFAVAFRLAGVVPRRLFELGLLLCGITIAGSALARAATSGFSTEVAIFRRSTTTDLGWGTANYIASLLLLLAPVAVLMTVQRVGLRRMLAWPALAMNASLQILVASRAAAVLFFAGLFAQAMLGLRSRARWFALILITATCVTGLLTPYGQGLIGRFTALRDIGSMVIRIWYFREGWRRTVAFFPIGMGLNQGLVYPDHLQGTDTHDYWLDLGGELGLPGVLLWFTVLALIFRELRRMRRPGSPNASLGLALQSAFWMSQFHTLVEPTFQGIQYQFLFFWLMGGSIAYARADEARAKASSER